MFMLRKYRKMMKNSENRVFLMEKCLGIDMVKMASQDRAKIMK